MPADHILTETNQKTDTYQLITEPTNQRKDYMSSYHICIRDSRTKRCSQSPACLHSHS